jgi:hypothetical protein
MHVAAALTVRAAIVLIVRFKIGAFLNQVPPPPLFISSNSPRYFVLQKGSRRKCKVHGKLCSAALLMSRFFSPSRTV